MGITDEGNLIAACAHYLFGSTYHFFHILNKIGYKIIRLHHHVPQGEQKPSKGNPFSCLLGILTQVTKERNKDDVETLLLPVKL